MKNEWKCEEFEVGILIPGTFVWQLQLVFMSTRCSDFGTKILSEGDPPSHAAEDHGGAQRACPAEGSNRVHPAQDVWSERLTKSPARTWRPSKRLANIVSRSASRTASRRRGVRISPAGQRRVRGARRLLARDTRQCPHLKGNFAHTGGRRESLPAPKPRATERPLPGKSGLSDLGQFKSAEIG